MIADLKPYPEYKNSGTAWLDYVPAHWAVRRMKYILRENDSRSTDGKEQLLRVSQFTGVTQRLSSDRRLLWRPRLWRGEGERVIAQWVFKQ